MEFYGVRIDRQGLMGLSKEFDRRLNAIMKTIYELAGETFNINSPQQLGRILFEKLRSARQEDEDGILDRHRSAADLAELPASKRGA
jgi:DNA polymerase I-like protein with 3'-5' exonuclease and polymerase domains